MSRIRKKIVVNSSRELYNNLLQHSSIVLQKSNVFSVNTIEDIGYYNNIIIDNNNEIFFETLVPDIVLRKKVLVSRYKVGKVSTAEIYLYNDKSVYRFIIDNKVYMITAM